MERIYNRFIQAMAGFVVILVLLFLFSDQFIILNTIDSQPVPPKPDAICSRHLDMKQDVQDLRLLPDRKSASISQALSYFETNIDQADDPIRFLSRGYNYTLFLTPDRAILSLSVIKKNPEQPDPEENTQTRITVSTELSILLMGSNPDPVIEGVHKLRGRSNYLVGNEPDKWHRDVPHYEMVKYSNLYDGIDLVYHNRKSNLEYDFIVAPGIDPGQIGFTIIGAERIQEDESGNLLLHTRLGDITIKAPETYQEFEGKKKYIASEYKIDDNMHVSFQFDPYDESEPLIIDPEIIYSTYFGGSGEDFEYGMDADDEGNVYVTGYTSSIDFPSNDGIQSLPGEWDIFVSKINTITSELIFTTIIGGSSEDFGYHIGLDENKNIGVAGTTASVDFPINNAFQPDRGGAKKGETKDDVSSYYDFDVFVLKLDPEGSSLIYSTYLGGSVRENLDDAVFDDKGNIYLSGLTEPYYVADEQICIYDFPQYPNQIENDCKNKFFVTKIDATGELQYSSLYEFEDFLSSIDKLLAVNETGNAFVLRQSRQMYSIYKLNEDGTTILDTIRCTFTPDEGVFFFTNDFQMDDQENICFAGNTTGEMLPAASNAYQPICNDNQEGFIIKLNQDASEIRYATYFGGSQDEQIMQIRIKKNGCILISGNTNSDDFPVKNAVQSTWKGETDVFLAEIDPLKSGEASLLFSTYIGGTKKEWNSDIVIDPNEKVYLLGGTGSQDFPIENALISTMPGFFSPYIMVFLTQEDTINLIYDEVVISGLPIFWPLQSPNTQQVLPQFLIKNDHDTVLFQFEGRSTDGRVGLRITNTMVSFEPPLILDMAVFDPDNMGIATFTVHNMGEGNRGVQFDVTKDGYYLVKVWPEPGSGPFPAPFQIHLAGNVGWPRPLLYPIPSPPAGGIPDTMRATRQDILINAPAPRPQLLRGKPDNVLINAEEGVSQTSLFKFTNIFQVSKHAIAVLTPFNKMGFEPGRGPVRAIDPNPMPDLTTPTAPFSNWFPFNAGGFVIDYKQVPIPASVIIPVDLRQAAVLDPADGICVLLPVSIPSVNGWTTTQTIIVDMGSGQEVVNGDGNDFLVYSPEGNYRVAVSNTVFKNTFIPIGEVFSGDQEFDLTGTGLQSIRFIRIMGEPSAAIDAVRALNFFCDEIRTDIGPISKVSYVTLTARRSKAPQTLLDPLIELIGPDGALNATNESGFGDDLSENCSDAAIINMELNQEGFYRYLGRGHDKTPNEESFGSFYTRYESAGSYDQTEIIISESKLTDITAQRTVTTTEKRQRDSYLFQAAPNQIINIAVYSSEIDVLVELYDPEEFLIAACDNYPGMGTNALISVQLPDSSFMGQAPLPGKNTYRIVVSAIDQVSNRKFTASGNAYIRKAATGEYSMKVTTSDELLDITEMKVEGFPNLAIYPNPFSQQTIITYQLQAPVHVVMEIYDLKGQIVLSLVNEIQTAGRHTVCWNGNDQFNKSITNGFYICRMIAGDEIRSKKVILER